MDEKLRIKIDDMIEKSIQNELSYQKDYITNDGWRFLEENASDKIRDKLSKDDLDDEDLSELTQENIDSYLADVIHEYETHNASIRVDNLY